MSILDKLTMMFQKLQEIKDAGRWEELSEIQNRIPQIMAELVQLDDSRSITYDLRQVLSHLQSAHNGVSIYGTSRSMPAYYVSNAQGEILKVIAQLPKPKQVKIPTTPTVTLN